MFVFKWFCLERFVASSKANLLHLHRGHETSYTESEWFWTGTEIAHVFLVDARQ
jgi:hypothetical protein